MTTFTAFIKTFLHLKEAYSVTGLGEILWTLPENICSKSRSSPSEVLLRKGALKICSKCEHPCRSVILIKLGLNNIEWYFPDIFLFFLLVLNIYSALLKELSLIYSNLLLHAGRYFMHALFSIPRELQ